MTKFQKILVGMGIVVALLFSVAGFKNSESSVGGVYNRVIQEFGAGLKAGTTNQFVVSSVGAITTSGTISSKELTSTLTADTTATVAQTGTTFYIGTAAVDLTLPAATASAGVVYRVVISANFATTSATLVLGPAGSAANDLGEGVLDVAGAVVLCAAEDTITFVNTAELIGDYVELRSNGVKWFISGQAGTTGAITCTDAD